jgi:hypothetical protein
MRRLAVCSLVVLTVGLVLAPGALAATGARHVAALAARHAAAAGTAAARLGAGPTYAISGHVLDYDGTGVAGALVNWGWWDGGNYNFGGTNMPLLSSSGTDADGLFSFANVGGISGSDDLDVFYPQSDSGPWLREFDTWNNDFSSNNDSAGYSYAARPGKVDLSITAAPSTPLVWVWAGSTGTGFARSRVPLTVDAGVASGTAFAMPPTCDAVAVGYENSYGEVTAAAESLASESVAAGATATTPVVIDWSQAQSASLAGPACQHSGKPGTVVKLNMRKWPVDEQAGFVGWFDTGVEVPYGATYTSTGSSSPISLRIPAAAAAGSLYEIDTWRSDAEASNMNLWTFYQVCTFKSSASAIHHGKSIRLSGKVPAGAGTVTIYSSRKAYGQPATLAAKGWVRVGSCKLKAGKFAGGLLHPKHTTWYVAKYPGYAFPAFTSVVKVTVR